LAWSSFCHNCGKPPLGIEPSYVPWKPKVEEPKPSLIEELSDSLELQEWEGAAAGQKETPGEPWIERMRLCTSCKKAIGGGEPFCSYCGAKQAVLRVEEPQGALDPRTMKVAITMLARVTEAKDHPEYSVIDQLTTLIGEVALGKEKPHDAHELSFPDQLRLLTLVFEYTRDKVGYKGEAFGEHIRWPWETIKTGGDCDCKVVLLATMLASLAFRKMHLLVLPPGSYLDTKEGGEKKIQGHVMLEVELSDRGGATPVRLDPSCPDCDVDEIPESVQPFLQNCYRIPVL